MKLILDKQNTTVYVECKWITIELNGGLLWIQRNLLTGYVHMNPSTKIVYRCQLYDGDTKHNPSVNKTVTY
jgi:hypothetical protein